MKCVLERSETRLEAETERLVSFIRTTDITSSPGAFEAVRASLEKATNQQRDVKAKLAALSSDAAEPRLPTVDEIMAYVLDVETRIKDDPTTAREALRQVLVSGKITLTPEADGACKAESMLIVGRLTWKTRKPRRAGPSAASMMIPATEVVEIGSCAGANPTLETAAVIPFEFHARKPPDGRRLPETWRRRVA